MPRASFTQSFSSNASARAAIAAIFPEMNGAHEKRSKTKMEAQKNKVKVSMNTQDAAAMRASKDTYSKLLTFLSRVEKKRE